MKKIGLLCGLVAGMFSTSYAAADASAADVVANYEVVVADVRDLLKTVKQQYVYLPQKKTDWACLESYYVDKAQSTSGRHDAVLLMELLLDEFYDSHMTLNTNVADSYRLNAPIFVQGLDDRFVIKDQWRNQVSNFTRNLHNAEVLSFNGTSMDQMINGFPVQCVDKADAEVRNWFANKVLAGRYDQPRALKLKLKNGELVDLDLDALEYKKHTEVATMNISNEVAVISINDSLGNNALIKAFDEMMDQLNAQQKKAKLKGVRDKNKGLVIDLRNTPSGGSTYVARALMGRLIATEQPYQRHTFDEQYGVDMPAVQRSWVEYVTPRLSTYDKPVVVLVNRWTGSMGEGFAIGLDGMGRAEVMGTTMARLAGAIYSFGFDDLSFGFQMPAEKLFHVDGTPRELYFPKEIESHDHNDNDLIQAIAQVTSRSEKNSAPNQIIKRSILDVLSQKDFVDVFSKQTAKPELTKEVLRRVESLESRAKAGHVTRSVDNIYPLSDDLYHLELVYRDRVTGTLELIMEMVATDTNGDVRFELPLAWHTRDWNQKKVGLTTYHYLGAFDEKRAALFDSKSQNLAQYFGVQAGEFQFYLANNYQEILKLLGVAYDKQSNGQSRDGFGVVSSVIFSVMGDADFSHDVLHHYASQVNDNRNFNAEEALAYLWGNGYYVLNGGVSAEFPQLHQVIKAAYHADPEADLYRWWMDKPQVLNPDIVPPEISVRTILSALICQEVYKQKGKAGLDKLLTTGKSRDDMLKVADELIGLNKQNFNQRLGAWINGVTSE